MTYDSDTGLLDKITVDRVGGNYDVTLTREPRTGRITEKWINGRRVGKYTLRQNGQVRVAEDELAAASYTFNQFGERTGALVSAAGGASTMLATYNELGHVKTLRGPSGIAHVFDRTPLGLVITEQVSGSSIVADSLLGYMYVPGSIDMATFAFSSTWPSCAAMSLSAGYAGGRCSMLSWRGVEDVDVAYAYAPRVAYGAYFAEVTVGGATRTLQRIVTWNMVDGTVASIEYRLGPDLVAAFEYDYAAGGRIVRADHSVGPLTTPGIPDRYWEYAYDAFGRLAQADLGLTALPGIPPLPFTYSYDETGNLLAGGAGALFGGQVPEFDPDDDNRHLVRQWSGKLGIGGMVDVGAAVVVDGERAEIDASGAFLATVDPAGDDVSAVETEVRIVAAGDDGTGTRTVRAEAVGSVYTPKTTETVSFDVRSAMSWVGSRRSGPARWRRPLKYSATTTPTAAAPGSACRWMEP